jgi:hypothetical protein
MREKYIHEAHFAAPYHESYEREVWEYFVLTMDDSEGEVDHMSLFYAANTAEERAWTATPGAPDSTHD